MNIPTGREAPDYTFEPDDVVSRLITGPTEDVLDEISPRHYDDYLDFETEYVGWFVHVGKKPNEKVVPNSGRMSVTRPSRLGGTSRGADNYLGYRLGDPAV